MRKISDLFQQALLAEAAYARFIDPDTEEIYASRESLVGALIAANFSSDPNILNQSAQASQLLDNWRITDHIPDTASGFSATVFERIDANGAGIGEFTLAISGSEPLSNNNSEVDINSEVWTDWFEANVQGIVGKGIAARQGIDLYNYWQSLVTSDGENYKAATLEILTPETQILRALWSDAQGDDIDAQHEYQAYEQELAEQGWFVFSDEKRDRFIFPSINA